MLKAKTVIIYGLGGDLGNLEVFAEGVRKQIPRSLQRDVLMLHLTRKHDFFTFVDRFRIERASLIADMHIISHAIGGGLYIGYHDGAVDARREDIRRAARGQGRRVTYEEVVEGEIGGILTDDFLRPPIRAKAAKLRLTLSPTATIKIWGCNSGVSGWLYSDNGEWNPAVARDDLPYWWRALNTKNTPKPSIAQAFANFFQRRTFGATSGAHVEVLHKGAWIKSSRYRAEVNKWPSPRLVHRLRPDRGDYQRFDPDYLP